MVIGIPLLGSQDSGNPSMIKIACTLENKENPGIHEMPYFLSPNHMEKRTNPQSFGKTKTGGGNTAYKRMWQGLNHYV